MAENVTQPQPIPSELTRIEGLLKRFFGYNEFQVIGQSQKTLKTGQEDWLATSKFFGLHVDARGETQGGYVLNLKLYKEKELLLETEAKLSKRSPLVIKGPQVGWGTIAAGAGCAVIKPAAVATALWAVLLCDIPCAFHLSHFWFCF